MGLAPERVANGVEEEGERGGGGGDDREQQGGGVYGIYRGIQLGDGGGTRADGVQGGVTGGGGHMTGGSTDFQGEK